MNITKYLQSKYNMAANAKVPTEFLLHELHIEQVELKERVKTILKRKTYPIEVTFAAFCVVCETYLKDM